MNNYCNEFSLATRFIEDFLYGKARKHYQRQEFDPFDALISSFENSLDSVSSPLLPEILKEIDEASNIRELGDKIKAFSMKKWPTGTKIYGVPEMLDPAIELTKQFHRKMRDRIRVEDTLLSIRKELAKKVAVAIDNLSEILKKGKKSAWVPSEHHNGEWFIYSSLSVASKETGKFNTIVEIKRNDSENPSILYTLTVEGAKGFTERKAKFENSLRYKGGRLTLTTKKD